MYFFLGMRIGNFLPKCTLDPGMFNRKLWSNVWCISLTSEGNRDILVLSPLKSCNLNVCRLSYLTIDLHCCWLISHYMKSCLTQVLKSNNNYLKRDQLFIMILYDWKLRYIFSIIWKLCIHWYINSKNILRYICSPYI